MNVQLAIVIGQLLIQYGPEFVSALIKIFNNNAPTQADWDAAFALAKNPIVQPTAVVTVPAPLPTILNH